MIRDAVGVMKREGKERGRREVCTKARAAVTGVVVDASTLTVSECRCFQLCASLHPRCCDHCVYTVHSSTLCVLDVREKERGKRGRSGWWAVKGNKK